MNRAFTLWVPRQMTFSGLLKYNLALSALIFLLLEIWRPCYFLTDDNLCVGLPFLSEVGRHLKSGQSPFVSDYLFGGHYSYLHDCSFFIWHPIYFVASLLADTSARFWMIDVVAFFFLMLTTSGFVVLAFSLREEFSLKFSDARLTFYTFSFVFSTFILTAGASWANILGNQSALPWLAYGLFRKSWASGFGLITLFSAHQILGGQFSATLSNDLFLSLFALGVAIYRRAWEPLLAWVAGNVLALMIVSPLLAPTIDGFLQSQRSSGLELEILNRYAVPGLTFPLSFFFGNFSEMVIFFQDDPFNTVLEFPNTPTLLACAAAWCLIPAIFSSARWHFLEILCLVLAGVLALLIIRPLAISEFMLHVPVLKSMRWPFREILQFLFFIHLFLVLRPQMKNLQFQKGIAIFSFVVFMLPLPFISAPTMNLLGPDRQLLFSGRIDKFWERVKTQLKPDDQIVSVLDANLWNPSWRKIPYSLLGAADYPAYFRVHSITGYSMTAPLDQVPLRTPPLFWFGTYEIRQIGSVERERPHLKIIWLESLDPLKITLHSDDAPTVDLTPFLSD